MFYSYYKKYAKYLGRRECLKYYYMQHILHINSNIPWPVHMTSRVTAWQNIKKADGLDKPTFLGAPVGCVIGAKNGIILGKNIWVGPHVSIISRNHSFTDYSQYDNRGPIEIGDNVWIGCNATILPGVKIADHTVIAAGAVVSKSITEPNTLWAGVPAKKIKDIGEYEGNMDCAEIELEPLSSCIIRKLKSKK